MTNCDLIHCSIVSIAHVITRARTAHKKSFSTLVRIALAALFITQATDGVRLNESPKLGTNVARDVCVCSWSIRVSRL